MNPSNNQAIQAILNGNVKPNRKRGKSDEPEFKEARTIQVIKSKSSQEEQASASDSARSSVLQLVVR